ncbi:hypothetical protein RO3G_01576 [Rhizopus delemar RA 99-880]|uniref:Uncharacterized protein n=1 Tax=Rhizopus delemar (strain RA 99-880 / ATCC MYA-4621 / FGSC 9543 / NRRL 43880) TaxID=246409 RepID=I1BKZ2_RHIO9|nr:hypothetical protein RO3G_01576 [Rhizopus delemar RA 99-880]|eukprot:EIE76872.1 hypothetical protein RO3G_01576 [Rhizopus delemar RA 99-880]
MTHFLLFSSNLHIFAQENCTTFKWASNVCKFQELTKCILISFRLIEIRYEYVKFLIIQERVWCIVSKQACTTAATAEFSERSYVTVLL